MISLKYWCKHSKISLLPPYKYLNNCLSSKFLQTCPQICIIGSGPAGFYTAQQILKSHKTAQIDIYEKLPVPFGLVRYGVAPDHPEVKNCINSFTEAAKNERVTFLGNISVGQDVTLEQLKNSYHAIILAYGAAKDRKLGIPGEDLKNVLSARRFVGWYNGSPDDASLDINLDVDEAIVVGHGNVAMDVSRILLSHIDELKKTDIPEPVLAKLSQSRIKRVTMVGRRRAQDVAFTIKEAREMINLRGCRPIFREKDLLHLPPIIESSPRPMKRLMELLHKTGIEPTATQSQNWSTATREWHVRFCLSPLEILPSNEDSSVMKGVQFGVNEIIDNRPILTDLSERVDAGLLLRSIGYTSFQIDPSIPFDSQKGLVPNEAGVVVGHKGLYVSGWIATGPVGVILSTMQSGFRTGKLVVSHLNEGILDSGNVKRGKMKVLEILDEKNVKPVTFDDWCSLDKFEVEEGQKYGKPREKVTDANKMVKIAKNEVV